jgi:uncharacterized protein (DUF849 family)
MTFLKAAINGARSKTEHAGVPVTPAEVADAAASVADVADVVHLHPRSPAGEQSIEPDDVRVALEAIRQQQVPVPLGVTTGLWCCGGDADRRLELVKAWDVLPDFASAAYSEPGADDVAAVLVGNGVMLESAVWTTDDVPILLRSRFKADNVRILIEPVEEDPAEAIAHAREMAARLLRGGVRCPLLFHGYDTTVWPLLRAAVEDGHEMRIGLEDGLLLPDGAVASGNLALVTAARHEASEARP